MKYPKGQTGNKKGVPMAKRKTHAKGHAGVTPYQTNQATLRAMLKAAKNGIMQDKSFPETPPTTEPMSELPLISFPGTPPTTKPMKTSKNDSDKEATTKASHWLLQNEACATTNDLPLSSWCRECAKQGNNENCRFQYFREIEGTKVRGFCTSNGPSEANKTKWQAVIEKEEKKTSYEYLIKRVKDTFLEIADQEERVLTKNKGNIVLWKKHIPGVREICDSCATSLFNYHWICQQCGLAICLDCYEKHSEERRSKFRPTCTTTKAFHILTQMKLTQIIPFECLQNLKQHIQEKFTTRKDTEQHLTTSDTVHDVWIGNPQFLCLKDPLHQDNLELFQHQWKKGAPILVEGLDKILDITQWQPKAFMQEFGEEIHELIDNTSSKILKRTPMREFWEGFEDQSKSLKNHDGTPLLLKLKDWPPGDDFAKLMPQRFDDLMDALPLPQYTKRQGEFNLASYLPDSWVKPDLGPKMYIAYGSAESPKTGTTNLHLDISDAVNIMVYVKIPHTRETLKHQEGVNKILTENECNGMVTGKTPGALWHIFNAKDTAKIRQVLDKEISRKKGKQTTKCDAIHDQSWYLDSDLLAKLYLQHGVKPYTFVQCLGDAVFIPAGAPHQVQNLNNCIKVAEDFVSPENVNQCVKLTREFSKLSKQHTNHEDKLQIKDMIYHAMNNATSMGHIRDE